ncbi:H-NS histone family protein [Sulfitobacter sp. F26169L]|uniref:H-NS histone family protein n=1 Tax=Sulfitobacter sp. F26169L TaxID=2996015 RepID=UPI002260B573|nr:H-NS histone family protein [Sulfitobacter sp. F26169L]MCX7567211.1 H-NS histone family protein [Sulfitobacter sp. F26169L]
MNIDLKSMSRKELEKLLSDVKKALSAAQTRDRRDARKAAERAAAEFGFSLNELDEDTPTKKARGKAPKKSAKPSKPKYADPADPTRTWTGKGRQPNWFRAAVEEGIDPATLEI